MKQRRLKAENASEIIVLETDYTFARFVTLRCDVAGVHLSTF